MAGVAGVSDETPHTKVAPTSHREMCDKHARTHTHTHLWLLAGPLDEVVNEGLVLTGV